MLLRITRLFVALTFMTSAAFAIETDSLSSFTELPWTSSQSSDHDYFGSLEFCSGGSGVYGYKLSSDTAPCGSLAPLIRMKAGKKYLLELKNLAANSTDSRTNIHAHGLHIPGNGNDDNIIRFVDSGYKLRYYWNIPSDHMEGKYVALRSF
jgi:FtsP/CotA-like multicopper oxidase with cupredoxin domain